MSDILKTRFAPNAAHAERDVENVELTSSALPPTDWKLPAFGVLVRRTLALFSPPGVQKLLKLAQKA